MSLVDAIPLPLFTRSARASATTIRDVFPAISNTFSTNALRRSPVLFILLGAWEVLRRSHQSRISDLEDTITRLSKKLASDEARMEDRDGQIAALKAEAINHQMQEGQRNTEIHDLKREVLAARTQGSTLLQQITEGKESVEALQSRVEGLEIDLGEKETVLRSLEDALKEEVAKNLEMEDQRMVSAGKEEELECQLNVMRQKIAVSNESIVGMQEALIKLEGDCEDKEKLIGSLTRAEERLRIEVDDAKAKDKEVLALKDRLQEHQDLVVERDTLIFNLSKKIEELEFNCAEIGDIPDRDSTLMHTARLTDEVKDDYELRVRHPNIAPDLNRHILKEKEERIVELEQKLAGMEGECKEKERKLKSLLSVNRKREERLAEMEARVLVLTSTNEDLEDMRTQERERSDRDAHVLRSKLIDTNGLITKVEKTVAKLEAEAGLKEAKVKSLSKAKDELQARVLKREKSLADLRAKLTAGQDTPMPSKPQKLHKASRSREEVLPAPTRAEYEEKIAELTDKLAESHRLLLKAGSVDISSPSSRLSAQSPIWPPPYEAAATSKNDHAHTIAAFSTDGFDSTSSLLLAPDRDRFSVPEFRMS